jgi:hypothetical protein
MAWPSPTQDYAAPTNLTNLNGEVEGETMRIVTG